MKSVRNEIFFFDSSKMLKVKKIHFNNINILIKEHFNDIKIGILHVYEHLLGPAAYDRTRSWSGAFSDTERRGTGGPGRLEN